MLEMKDIVGRMTDEQRIACIAEWDRYMQTNKLADNSAIRLAVEAFLVQLPRHTIPFGNAVNSFMLEVFRHYAERYLDLCN